MSTQTCSCSHCGESFLLPPDLSGSSVYCPSCGQQVLLQDAGAFVDSASVPAATTHNTVVEESPGDYLIRVRENSCYGSARTAIDLGTFILYCAGVGIIAAGCYYGEKNGGGPAVSVIGWVIIALTKGGKHLVLAVLDIADVHLEVNRRK